MFGYDGGIRHTAAGTAKVAQMVYHDGRRGECCRGEAGEMRQEPLRRLAWVVTCVCRRLLAQLRRR